MRPDEQQQVIQRLEGLTHLSTHLLLAVGMIGLWRTFTLPLTALLLGCAATGIVCSNWLLVFATLLLGSLVFLKRHVEISGSSTGSPVNESLPGRGAYSRQGQAAIHVIGITLGILALAVFPFYIASEQAQLLYHRPLWLLGGMAAIGAWLARIWRLARQPHLISDPLIFALGDFPSYLLGAVALGFIWLAS